MDDCADGAECRDHDASMERVEGSVEFREACASSADAVVNVEVVASHAGGGEVDHLAVGALVVGGDSRVADDFPAGRHGVS